MIASCQWRLAERDGRGVTRDFSFHSIRFYYNRLILRSTDVIGKQKCVFCYCTGHMQLSAENLLLLCLFMCRYVFVYYLAGSYNHRWCLPSAHRCLHSGMVRDCMACRGSHSVGQCTLEDSGSCMSPPRSHTHHH